MLKENIINGAFFSVFKSINQNSSKDLNHTLGLTLSSPGLVGSYLDLVGVGPRGLGVRA